MKTVWLIELSTGNGPAWLTHNWEGFYWSHDANVDLTYDTKEKAHDGWFACQSLDEDLERFSDKVTITEHQFG